MHAAPLSLSCRVIFMLCLCDVIDPQCIWESHMYIRGQINSPFFFFLFYENSYAPISLLHPDLLLIKDQAREKLPVLKQEWSLRP